MEMQLQRMYTRHVHKIAHFLGIKNSIQKQNEQF